MFTGYPIIRFILVSWTSMFVAVASVPRCDAIADLISLFHTQHIEELSCHGPADQTPPTPASAHYDFPAPCPCITLEFADFFQQTQLRGKFAVLVVLDELDVSAFINRFWLFYSPNIDVPPPRLV